MVEKTLTKINFWHGLFRQGKTKNVWAYSYNGDIYAIWLTLLYETMTYFNLVATVNLLKSNVIFTSRYLNMFVCACKPTEPCQDLEGKDCFRDEECGEGGFCSQPG